MQTNEAEAKRIINALKTGVIPDMDLDLLCIGRESIIREFDRCLDLAAEGAGIVKFISGEYGSGKSFMLGRLRQQAIRRGFAVARVQLGRSVHLNSIDTFYYSIMHNLTVKMTNSEGTDFESLFDQWLGRIKSNPHREAAAGEIKSSVTALESYSGPFARAFLAYIKARISNDGELAAAAASWIKGDKNIPAALKAKFDIKGDLDRAQAMDSLKAFIHLLGLTGYKGLAILADELETAMNLRSDIRMGCYESLRYLVDECGCGDFKNCLFVFAGTDRIFEDAEKGLKTYQALSQRLGDSSAGLAKAHDMRRPVISLKKLDNDELQVLAGRILDLHRIAYAWLPRIGGEAARNWALLMLSKEKGADYKVNTREFIIKLIEILDTLEQNPGYSLFNSDLKMVNKNGVDVFVNVLPRKTNES